MLPFRREHSIYTPSAKQAKQRDFTSTTHIPLRRFAAMNATIEASSKTAYHTVANAEFTAVYNRKVYDFPNNQGENRIGSTGNYHLFIRYADKVYVEVKDVGEIVMPYDTLKKNKHLDYYYKMSHKLTYDKNLVYQHLQYSCDYHIRYQINDDAVYPDEERWWGITTAFLETTIDTQVAKIIDNEVICHYKINPYDLENWDCSTPEDIEAFLENYMTIQDEDFDRMCPIYNRVVGAYQENWMTKELNEIEKEGKEIEAFFEDKKNVIALSMLSDSNTVENGDVLAILYNILVSPNGHQKYKGITSELEKCGRLESVAQILEA